MIPRTFPPAKGEARRQLRYNPRLSIRSPGLIGYGVLAASA